LADIQRETLIQGVRKMKRVMILVCSIVLLGLILVACSLPASTASNTFATNTPNVPFPIATNAQLVHEVVSGTQTAQAMQGLLPTQGLPTIPQGSTGLPTFPSLYTSTPGGLAIGTPTKTLMPFATSTPGKPASYTIHEGETCYCLARRFNINPDTLVSSNAACNSTLYAGTNITIPQSTWCAVAIRSTPLVVISAMWIPISLLLPMGCNHLLPLPLGNRCRSPKI
jgi:hypothetical protein